MSEPRFIADAMLGRLAQWLRVLDLDTTFEPSMADPDLVALSHKEGRVLLTRDRRLVSDLRPERSVLLAADDTFEQLREVAEHCGLRPPFALFTRCLVCNTKLREATPAEVEALVPARSRATGAPFLRCPGCERMYWHGTHVRRMRASLAEAFPEWFS